MPPYKAWEAYATAPLGSGMSGERPLKQLKDTASSQTTNQEAT